MKEETRISLFFSLCIGIRLFLVYLAYFYDNSYNHSHTKWFRGLVFFMGLALIINASLRTLGLRPEKGFSGGKVYWNSFIHGVLYLLYVVLAFSGFKRAWIILLFDVFVGIVFVVNNYFL